MGRPRTLATDRAKPEKRERRISADRIYTVGEAAKALRIALVRLRVELRAGRIKHVRNGRRYQIRGAWLLDWFEGQAKDE